VTFLRCRPGAFLLSDPLPACCQTSAVPDDASAPADDDETDENAPADGTSAAGGDALAARSFAALVIAATGLTAALALVLFPVFMGLGLTAAPYWAVGIAVVGGIVMRRALLRDPSVAQTVIFSACAIGGALAGLAVANVLLS